MIEILQPNFKFGDERGLLVQLVREGYKQVNVVTSKKGYKRGGHYHKLNHEVFYIVRGAVDVTARCDGKEEIHHFEVGDMFDIPPMVSHDFDFLDDTILIGLYDKGVELANGEKDIYAG